LRQLALIIIAASLTPGPYAFADDTQLYYDIQAGVEYNKLENFSLGDDPDRKHLTEKDLELELDLEYRSTTDFAFVLTTALIDESESIHGSGREQTRSGIELREAGLSYRFGDDIESTVSLGRLEFESTSLWWSWWDDELDNLSLQSRYKGIETLLAVAQAQAPEASNDDFIDPEIDEVRHLIFNLSWEIPSGQSLHFYYLKQHDNSPSHRLGESVNSDRIDEEDADLIWKGVSLFAEFELNSAGVFDLELHYSEVSGDSTLYEFDELTDNRSEISDQSQSQIDGRAHGYLIRWTPSALNNITLYLAGAKGTGNSSRTESYTTSYRQTGLQGDLDSYGELFQPELSNLEIGLIGLEWQISQSMSLALMHYDYRQVEPSDEIRDSSLDVDPSGASSDLGQEYDLVYSIEPEDSLELNITYAKFKAGRAYAAYSKDTANYFGVELVYTF
jgi:hypothetical protein